MPFPHIRPSKITLAVNFCCENIKFGNDNRAGVKMTPTSVLGILLSSVYKNSPRASEFRTNTPFYNSLKVRKCQVCEKKI